MALDHGTVDEQLLEQRFAALEAARGWSPRVVSRLETLIRSGDDAALFRINPLQFASERRIPEPEAIDLLLHATAHGLLEMDWLLLCPMCACVVESLRNLQRVGNQYHCPMCRCDYESMLDEYIAVAFTVSPTIRPIIFHRPQELTAHDYYFVYRMTADGRVSGGTPFVEFMKAATHDARFLPASSVTRFEASSAGGMYFGWDIDTASYIEFPIEGPPSPATQILRIRYGENGCEPAERVIAPGQVVFEIENTTSRRGLFALATIPPGIQRAKLPFAPFLSGARLLATQTFRDLFRSELVKANEGIGVRDVTLVFTDLKGSTALYDRVGDLNAFSLVQQHFELLLGVTVRHNGAVIKTLGDAVMAAFLSPEEAVRAVIAMRDEIEQFNKVRPGRDLILKIGIHKGPSIAVTLNERLDYFGQTVNIAARVQSLANGNEICFTRDVYDAAGVQGLLAPYPLEHDRAQLKGVNQETLVYRVGTSAESRASC
jgi:class 3 adenylate cyclase